jgi:hypothetical protein
VAEKLSQDELARRRNRLSLLPVEAESLRVNSSNISNRFTMKLNGPGGAAGFGAIGAAAGPDPRANWSRRPSILEKTGGRLQSVHASQLSVIAGNKTKREYRRNVVCTPSLQS